MAGVAILASGAILAVFGLVLLRPMSPTTNVDAGDGNQPTTAYAPGPTAGNPATASAGAPAPTAAGEPSNLLTPEGMRAAVAALEKATGSKQFTETTIYPAYVNTGAPVPGQPGLFDRFGYRNGTATRSGAGGQLSDPTIALGTIDWSVLPTLFTAADQRLGIAHPTSR
ncbi:hypothetical protein ACW9HQ_48150, partial [Nocardia gipuzkoensis]